MDVYHLFACFVTVSYLLLLFFFYKHLFFIYLLIHFFIYDTLSFDLLLLVYCSLEKRKK